MEDVAWGASGVPFRVPLRAAVRLPWSMRVFGDAGLEGLVFGSYMDRSLN